MQQAAQVLGATIECLDFGDSPLLIGPERRQQLLELFRHRQPNLVLTHWKDDILHPDHCAATEAVIWASRYCFRPGIEGGSPPCPAPQVLFYETTLGTAPVATTCQASLLIYRPATSASARHSTAFTPSRALADRYGILARYRAIEAQSAAWMKDVSMPGALCV